MWDDSVSSGVADKRGKVLENWLAVKNMTHINHGTPTHTAGTAPDTSFVSPGLLDKMEWKTVNELGSDHIPIILTYQDDISRVNEKPKYKWRLKDANWEAFAREVEAQIPSHYIRKNVNKMEKRLRKAILKAANKHVRKRKITQTTRACITPEIKTMIERRNKLKKDVGRNRKDYIRVSKKVVEMMREVKSARWMDYVDQLSQKSDVREFFGTIRALDGRVQPQNRNEVLEVDGVSHTTDSAKAEQFAKTYRRFSKLPVRKSDRQVRKKIWRHAKRKDTILEESEKDISMEEMDRVIMAMSNNKAPGRDDIPYEFIRHLGPKAREMLLCLYRKCWSGEGLPTIWRTSSIMPQLKEGKDPKLTESYRPISLTSCMGKILEKIVADRLISILESRNLLSNNQAGFRSNRCTTDQVLKLVQDASDQIHAGKETYRTITAFFDYEKAYDKVWRDGLLSKMIDLKVPRRYTTYVRHFLSGRNTVVEVNNVQSKSFILKEGLPQGSSISPLLFLIFINDIDVDLDAKTIASLFADDTSIWRSGGERPEGETGKRTAEEIREMDTKMMQYEVDKIMNWASKWKMRVNTGKTKSMVISSATADRCWDPELTADGKQIDLVQEYKFLGATIANDLRFKSHIDNVVTKGKKRVNVLKCMSGKDWGNSLETQRTLYIQYVRSALEFSSPSYAGWVSDSVLQRMQRVQNEALRSVGCLAKTCPVDLLHLETGVEPISDRFAKNDKLLWERCKRLPEVDPRRKLQEKAVTTRLRTRLGWRTCTEPEMAELRGAPPHSTVVRCWNGIR